jgi:hypothetical protein
MYIQGASYGLQFEVLGLEVVGRFRIGLRAVLEKKKKRHADWKRPANGHAFCNCDPSWSSVTIANPEEE